MKLTLIKTMLFAGITLSAQPAIAKAKKTAPAPPSFADLDQDAVQLDAKTKSLADSDECVPMHLKNQGTVGILALHCTDKALAADGEEYEISETFTAPEEIARRFNFWRRIYSVWSKDQYVMHLSQYPEVVVEAYDASRSGKTVGDVRKEHMIKAVAESQRDRYSKMFLQMHRTRNDESRFSPAMKRVSRSMAHIKDGDKYLIAARTLRLQRGQRDFIASGLTVGPKYLPSIELEFKEQGIPVEISRLAYVESSFNLAAYSKVGASGVYQIMPATGRQYLKMHSGVDERQDPIKASRAAAKLLKMNYAMTGSWPLAITAYNHGVGGIRKAMRATGSKDIVTLINRYYGPSFGFASKNFYASYLGMLATLKDSDRLFPDVPKVDALAFDNVRLSKSLSIQMLRKQYKISLTDISSLNPDISRAVLRGNGFLPKGYVLKVPAKAKGQNVASETATPNS